MIPEVVIPEVVKPEVVKHEVVKHEVVLRMGLQRWAALRQPKRNQ